MLRCLTLESFLEFLGSFLHGQNAVLCAFSCPSLLLLILLPGVRYANFQD